MSELWTNPWVVGIGAGILSGLVVWFVSRYVLSRSEDREMAQKISAANREVLYAIRPSIPTNSLPTREVIIALVRSTARKYGVDRTQMLTVNQITNDLIKEVMDSSFVPANTKLTYCEQLLRFKKLPEATRPTVAPEAPEPRRAFEEGVRERERYLHLFSTVLSLLVGLVTVFVVTQEAKDLLRFTDIFKLFPPIVVAIAAGTLVIAAVFYIVTVERRRQRAKRFLHKVSVPLRTPEEQLPPAASSDEIEQDESTLASGDQN